MTEPRRRLRKPQTSGTALAQTGKSAIADSKTARLKELEGVIREELPGHIRSWVKIGLALREIKDGELFKPYFPDWDEYVAEQWGLSRSYVYQLIDAAKVVDRIQGSLRAMGKSAIADSTILTIIGNEWRARQLKGREAEVVRRIKNAEDPQDAVDAEIAKAKREKEEATKRREARKEVVTRVAGQAAPADMDDEPGVDDFMVMHDRSGKVRLATKSAVEGRWLVGGELTDAQQRRLVRDSDPGEGRPESGSAEPVGTDTQVEKPPDYINPKTIPWELAVVARRLEAVADRLKQPVSKTYRDNVIDQADELTSCAIWLRKIRDGLRNQEEA
jgi:hypothetical protein